MKIELVRGGPPRSLSSLEVVNCIFCPPNCQESERRQFLISPRYSGSSRSANKVPGTGKLRFEGDLKPPTAPKNAVSQQKTRLLLLRQ